MARLPIILGSASRWRHELLQDAGIEHTTMAPDIDEKAIRAPDPEHLVLKLAHAKNQALHMRLDQDVILITSDQVVVCNGCIYEKPEDANEARGYLQSYNQFPAETLTAVVIENTATKQKIEIVDRAYIEFHQIPDAMIETLIEDGHIFDCAGGFQVEGELSSQYVKSVVGDINSVKGLPLAKVIAAIATI